jgi:hypothetical protein
MSRCRSRRDSRLARVMTWKSLMKGRAGDYTTEAGLRFLQERSPLTRAGQIVRPLLIGQGANAVRVKAAEVSRSSQQCCSRASR